jgi:hypothetical protein
MAVHVEMGYVAVDPVRLPDALGYLADEARVVIGDELGNLGMSLAANTELGVAVAGFFWVSGDAMRESEKKLAGAWDETGRRGAGTVSVERFEVASSVRVAPGAGVRLTRLETAPARVSEAIEAYEDVALPWLLDTPGFCAAILCVDRRTGKSVVETSWRDAETLAASRSAAAAIRVDAVAATDSAMRAVEEYYTVINSM